MRKRIIKKTINTKLVFSSDGRTVPDFMKKNFTDEASGVFPSELTIAKAFEDMPPEMKKNLPKIYIFGTKTNNLKP